MLVRQNVEPELLKSLHSDIKDGHVFNSHIEILQAISSSKPYVLLSRNQANMEAQNKEDIRMANN